MRKLKRASQRQARKRKRFRRRAVAAGTAVAITLAAGVSISKVLADDHQLPVSNDADADLIANAEELAIGYRLFKPDQNRNHSLDGVELAKRCAEIINQLPWDSEALPGETYKWCALQWGLETCDICGETVNMGPAGIVNPQLGLSVDCPLIAVHYMEHGSFGYAGDVHEGRLRVPALLRALELRYPCDPNEHQLPLYTDDLDGDLMDDAEELSAGYNLHDPDQDKDITPDGIELASQCAEVIDGLPLVDPNDPPPDELYKVEHRLRGLETCDICSLTVNMGTIEIINPQLALNIEFPFLSAHYFSHGSFSCSGDIHTTRVDVPLLVSVLEMPRSCGHLGTIYLPPDLNEDCIVNFKDVAGLADKWLKCTDPDDPNCDQL
ncbi:MAG: hypothetical protein ACYTEL_22970 [Planctomycetota bacterium]|jgi:hypothetical protein